jgi:hypothetical protein
MNGPFTDAACSLASTATGAAGPTHVPFLGWARGYLFCIAAFSLFVCFVLGMAFAAGPSRPGHNPWRTAGLIATILLVPHAGYLLAPFCLGTRFGTWAMWMMLPLALFVILAQASMLRWLPFGPREGVNAGAAWVKALTTLAFMGGLYLVPPGLLWWFRAR